MHGIYPIYPIYPIYHPIYHICPIYTLYTLYTLYTPYTPYTLYTLYSGVGFIASLKNKPSHHIIQQAMVSCCNMEHRGATSSDDISGDGAGVNK